MKMDSFIFNTVGSQHLGTTNVFAAVGKGKTAKSMETHLELLDRRVFPQLIIAIGVIGRLKSLIY